jgi:hypothetical protein
VSRKPRKPFLTAFHQIPTRVLADAGRENPPPPADPRGAERAASGASVTRPTGLHSTIAKVAATLVSLTNGSTGNPLIFLGDELSTDGEPPQPGPQVAYRNEAAVPQVAGIAGPCNEVPGMAERLEEARVVAQPCPGRCDTLPSPAQEPIAPVTLDRWGT